MKKFLSMSLLALTTSVFAADTTSSEWELFKNNVSPSMVWGEDSIMLIPKANTLGRGHLYLSTTMLDSGKIQNDRLFLTTNTAMLSTSDDVELGYSRRVFVWDNFDYTNIKMDSFHLKARVFHLTDNYIPQIAVGVNLVSLAANNFNKQKDYLYNPYVVTTIRAPLGTEKAVLTITAMAEKVMNEGQSSEPKFGGGVDFKIFNHLYLLGEIVGVNKDGKNGVVNTGAKLKFGWVSLGAGMFNIARNTIIKDDNSDGTKNKRYWMANISLDIPFDKLFKGDSK
ncbi:hypothetical protein [Methanothermococcus sp.]|uniref:hypothetical protein n=1 Tax=Methanothermococcus sp. TaxID=2614238 RepID=UPI0025F4BB57|nr:hypothetical protein [Methanothermococcus sp.]